MYKKSNRLAKFVHDLNGTVRTFKIRYPPILDLLRDADTFRALITSLSKLYCLEVPPT